MTKHSGTARELDGHFLLVLAPDDGTGRDGKTHLASQGVAAPADA